MTGDSKHSDFRNSEADICCSKRVVVVDNNISFGGSSSDVLFQLHSLPLEHPLAHFLAVLPLVGQQMYHTDLFPH